MTSMSTTETLEPTAEVQRQLDLASSQLALYVRDLKHMVEAERQKAQELAAANTRLQLLDRLKTDFLSFICHELRTPLHHISALDLLDPHGDTQEQAEPSTSFGRAVVFQFWTFAVRYAISVPLLMKGKAMVLIPVLCPYCHGDRVRKRGKTDTRKQRYRCQNPECPHQSFLLTPAYKGRLPEVKQQVLEMSLNGSGVRDTARVLQISPTTVIHELKKRGGPHLRQYSTPENLATRRRGSQHQSGRSSRSR